MKRAVITGTAVVAMLAFPLNAIASSADKHHKGYLKHEQQWQHHREQRRADARHRTTHKAKHAKHIVKTDYRAVKHRVNHRAKHQRIAQQRHRNWVKNHGYHHRLSNSRDVYIHYYGPARHYDRHQRHYPQYHIGHHRHHKRHDHDNDYLEWLGIMYLLNDIYDEDY